MNDEQESKSPDETTDVTTTTEEAKKHSESVTDQADGHGTTEPEQAEAKEGVTV